MKNKLTAQQIFSKSRAHVLKQGRPAVEKPGSSTCRYRQEVDGKVLKCAVGCFIQKKNYIPSLEGKVVSDVLALQRGRNGRLLPSYFEEHRGLLTALQRAHDRAAVYPDFVAEYTRLMAEVALNHGLRNE